MQESQTPATQHQLRAGLDPELQAKVCTIERELAAYKSSGKRICASSSFQTNSLVLLHLLSELAPEVVVYFLNTGFHFPETLRFQRKVERQLGLQVRDLRSEVSRLQQRDNRGRLLFASDPDYCCHLNKVVPLEPVLAAHDIWISGVRASQSTTRASMKREQASRRGVLRYHPLLDWSSRDVWSYLKFYELPEHPLEAQGYVSVGCEPCTRRLDLGQDGDNRSGRWFGLTKTECGLHL